MIKIIRMAVIIVSILGIILNINCISFAQDDDGGGGDAGDVGDAGDMGDAGDAGDIDDGGSDIADYQEESVVETQYEETVVPAPVVTSTSTSVTHGYVPGGYVYDRGRSAIVGAAVVGAAVGAAAGSTAATAGKNSAVVEKTTKSPVVVKKRPPAKTTAQTAQTAQAAQATKAKNDENKK